MRTNILFVLVLVLLSVMAVLGHRSSTARLATLEVRVQELDEALINVTVPMDLFRQDLSDIYKELDTLLQAASPASTQPAPAASAARQQPPELTPREFSYRDSPVYRQKAEDYPPLSPSDYEAGVYTGNSRLLPKARSFHGVTDEQG